MASTRLIFEHDLELSPAIVWDALVDADLVSGWLGEALIDPVVGGDYLLSWLGSPAFAPVDGRVEAIDPPRALVVQTTAHGRLAFSLTEHEGGSRGTWTKLHLDVDVEIEQAFEQRVRDNWRAALDQLEQLLRGHPVHWDPALSDPSAPLLGRDRSGG